MVSKKGIPEGNHRLPESVHELDLFEPLTF